MINFFCEDIEFKVQKPNFLKKWLKESAVNEGFTVKDLNYIFCSDEYLHKINLEYLDHDTLTDIITFDNTEKEGKIEGDIFISIDRVRDNAKDFSTEFDHELRRVLVHGLLHLCGYLDETDEEEAEMRTRENEYLSKYTN